MTRTPVLLNKRYIGAACVLSVVMAFAVFAGGFYSGYHTGLGEVDSWPLDLPQVEQPVAVVFEQQLPESVEPGASIDVDVADPAPEAQSANVLETLDVVVEAESATSTEAASLKKHPAIDKSTNAESASIASTFYAVQVGMFSLHANARQLVDKLSSQSFDAYIVDYINRDKQTKYNVRIGHYPDRFSGKQQLALYKQHFNKQAYLVISE